MNEARARTNDNVGKVIINGKQETVDGETEAYVSLDFSMVQQSKRHGVIDAVSISFPTFSFGGARQDKGRPLPKFGEWDVNNPASAEGFTVIFNKARDEKKTKSSGNMATQRSTDPIFKNENYSNTQFPQKKWFCCG
ncbi:hypothetical protein VNO77_24781 [Canavalia gladiata]|uniref:RIN4 pathogenic type III effector avirulence factor Avr cleavage site domain-containing protein n=1 Tax=Canavalia gladiata TaxID=3824 RepID=A0AAN9L6Z2_CANGL